MYESRTRIALAILFCILMTILTVRVLFSDPKAEGQSFDHSQCQYPSRTTNPPDGCDNSDPAIPYCVVKGLPEDCTEGQESQRQKPVKKPKTVDKPVQRVHKCE